MVRSAFAGRTELDQSDAVLALLKSSLTRLKAMKPVSFEYLCPTTLAEAVEMLSRHRGDCKILAGGQSLVPAMNFRLARPSILIDINNVTELSYVRVDGGDLAIGSLTRHAFFHKPPVDSPLGILLNKVVQNIAHYPIRQRGSYGGSLSHADPASEWCLTTQTLRANLVLASERGKRTVTAQEFFKGTFMTALQEDEILAEIRLPLFANDWTSGFYEFSRRKGDFALAMCLTALRIEGGVVRDARIGAGGIADIPLRLPELEEAIVGQPANQETVIRIASMSRDLVDPPADIHGSSEYRRDLLVTVIKRALTEAMP